MISLEKLKTSVLEKTSNKFRLGGGGGIYPKMQWMEIHLNKGDVGESPNFSSQYKAKEGTRRQDSIFVLQKTGSFQSIYIW